MWSPVTSADSKRHELRTDSDVIAMGVVLATVECGGPIIAYRGGRIDAMFAGPPGVPTPEQPVEDFIETFRKQGFTQEEMIGLVACGYTLGLVSRIPFSMILVLIVSRSQQWSS
jgi:catalase (peroxidase I)